MCPIEEDYRLPKESRSQRYGKEAVQAFENARPQTWSIHSLEGDDDFGLDKQVQVPNPNLEGRIIGLFYVQIKGSADIALSADGKSYSVPLKITTLNYYARIQDPVMLVFADLSAGLDPRDSPVYWTWISEDIQSLLTGRSDFSDFHQQTVTFHVPANNRLTRDFDVVDELAKFRRRASALKGLCYRVSAASGEDVPLEEAITTITQAVQRHGRPLMSAFLESHDSRWVDPPAGSITASLKSAEAKILENKAFEADEILAAIAERVAREGATIEQADFEFLTGRVYWIRGDLKQAVDHYGRAQLLDEHVAKYHVAYIGAKLALAYPQNMEAVQGVFDSIRDSDNDEIVCIKARVLGALGDTGGAFKLIEGSESRASDVARALLAYLQQDWDATIAFCERGLARDDLRRDDETLFRVLIARALYYRCLNDRTMASNNKISVFGSNDMDFTLAQKAWTAAKEALRLLRESGWPPNAEYIVDVVGVLASVLNHEKEVIVDLAALSRTRPNLQVAHEGLHHLALMSGDNELALEALSRLPDNDPTLHKRIYLLHGLRRHREALDLAEERLLAADSNDKLHGPCLGAAALSAHALLSPGRAVPFERSLCDSAELSDDAAVYDYVYACNENPLTRQEALNQLCGAFRGRQDSIPIQDNLFSALDAHKHEQAELAVAVAEKIGGRRRLASSEVTHLAQAYATLRHWDALLSLVDDAMSQYGKTAILESIRALAFEGKGDTARALEILESILASNNNEQLAIDSYIQISARNGFHRQAMDQLETLYEKARNDNERISYLRQMFGLEMALNPRGARMFNIAWRYGQLCDKSDEEEEGIFLQMFLMSTLREEIKVSPEQQTHLHERASAYFNRYPNSKFIKAIDFPHDASPETFKQVLDDAFGITPEADRWFQRMEKQLQSGQVAVPFAWRPKRLLRNVPDIAYLWYVAKHSSRDAHGYHLNIYVENEQNRANITRGPNRRPLCDLTTLIVLAELELLDLAFEVLGTIAIGKTTIYEIQHLGHPYIGGYTLFQEMSEKLRARIRSIEQPGFFSNAEADRSKLDESLEEVARLAQSGSYVLFVDDALARQYVGMSAEGVESFTTIDLLKEAERRGLLTARQVAEKLAQLIDWRVGVVVEARYFIAAIPETVARATDTKELIEILVSDKTYVRMINGLWDFRHDYRKVLNHWRYQLAHVAQSKDASVDLMAALWWTWLDKVKFRTELSFEPLEHAAWSFILTTTLAKEDQGSIARLWIAFVRVVEIIYGPRMDEEKERYARTFVGQVAARIVHGKEDVEARDRIPEIVRLGLVPGTADYDCFNRGYESERIRLENRSAALRK